MTTSHAQGSFLPDFCYYHIVTEKGSVGYLLFSLTGFNFVDIFPFVLGVVEDKI